MSEKNVTCVKSGLWPWLILDIVLVCVTLAWLLVNYQKTNFFQGMQKTPEAVVQPKPGLQATPVALNPPKPPKPTTKKIDGVTRPTPRIISFNQVIQAVSPSVVTISTSGIQSQSGSGVVIHSQGYILTNYHVVQGAKNIEVTVMRDQAVKTYPAELIDFDNEIDLAVIKVAPGTNDVFTPAPLGDSDTAVIGSDILVVGSPFGLSQSASAGIISNANRTLSTANRVYEHLIQTDASLNLGSSGGALVNTSAEVIGINVAILSMTQSFSGIGFAIPINIAKDKFSQFIEIVQSPLKNNMGVVRPPAQEVSQRTAASSNVEKTKGRAWLGVDADSVNDAIVRKFNLPFNRGVLINNVFDKSPASKGGFYRGDIIVRVNDRLVKDEEMLWSFMSDCSTGDDVKFTVYRNGTQVDVFLKL
ncbi:MAG: trypsin-like peptidase domain-containing protein [Candidatus Riflebacteria bacterium]|nr:trypsin-like peptidase domain-containing protein [Candidatus Riflebacteria bacterium]